MQIYTHPVNPGIFINGDLINNLVAHEIDNIDRYLGHGLPPELLFGAKRVALASSSEIQFLELDEQPLQHSQLANFREVFSFLKDMKAFDIMHQTFLTASSCSEVKHLIGVANYSPVISIVAWFDENENEFWVLRHSADSERVLLVEANLVTKKLSVSVKDSDYGDDIPDYAYESLEMVTDHIMFQKYAIDEEQYLIVETLANQEVVEHPVPVHFLNPDELRQLADHMERVDEVIAIDMPFQLDDTHPLNELEFSLIGCDTHFNDFRGALLVQEKGVLIRANQKQYLAPKELFESNESMKSFIHLLQQIKLNA